MKDGDALALRILHDKYYSEFNNPDFMDLEFSTAFTVLNDKGEIILGGGVKRIAETVLVTDKSKNIHEIGDALLQALKISKWAASQMDVKWLHAFVKDDAYARHLVKHGFNPRCSAFSMRVDDGRR
jgi:hypothetical protein